jgi:peptidoglycan/LPS O-acetylase OafA/YrhL
MTRISSLDLLRGLAALAVAIPHWILISQPESEACEITAILAVEVFFTLSGFVLAPQILACMRSKEGGQLRVFLARRWMRTIPPFVLALISISILTGHLLSADMVRYLFYVQNLFAQHNASDFFPIAWSLSAEEWFYVLFPALLILFYRQFGPAGRSFELIFVVSFIVVVTALRMGFGDHAQWGADVRRVVVFRIDSIAYGFLLYLLIGRPHRGGYVEAYRAPHPLLALLLLAATAIAAFAVAAAIAESHSRIAEYSFPFAAAVLGMSAIVFFASLDPMLKRHAAAVATAEFLGRVSYTAYLFHTIIATLLYTRIAQLPLAAQLCVYLPAIGLFCWALYLYFERPILAARPDYYDPAKSSLSWRYP